MKLTFLGAAHEVTGSCFYIEACGRKILIDCGMEQGQDIYENQGIPSNPSDIDCVLLTHAHIDHSGCLPQLYGNGFRGPIYATDATCDLCDIMLRDSAHIQMFEAEWRNRKARRAGKEEYVPLYTVQDAIEVMRQFRACDYDHDFEIFDGIRVRFIDVGHLLGSSSIEIWIEENGVNKKLVFSGDIGNFNQPLIKDPEYITDADYVIMESTYGGRNHREVPNYVEELAGVIQQTFDEGGNVIVPSFAVGRTQELLYFLRQIKESGMIKGHDGFLVYVDSPLAIEATHIFRDNYKECFDEQALELLNKGINPISFRNLKFSITSSDSKEINFDKKPKIIISASGMCEAGRIKHHLKHNLWRKECTILFVGYQAKGTLGRAILDGAPTVKLFGEDIDINAKITFLSGISGHADQDGLIQWIQSFHKKPKHVFIVHGEDSVCDAFANKLCEDYGYRATAPYTGEEYDLVKNVCVKDGNQIKLEREIHPKTKATAAFDRLRSAGQRLSTVIRNNEGGANKDLAKFTDQINALCDKWDR